MELDDVRNLLRRGAAGPELDPTRRGRAAHPAHLRLPAVLPLPALLRQLGIPGLPEEDRPLRGPGGEDRLHPFRQLRPEPRAGLLPLRGVRARIPGLPAVEVRAGEAQGAVRFRERGLRQSAAVEPAQPAGADADHFRPGHPGMDRLPLPGDGRRAARDGALRQVAQPGGGHRGEPARHHRGQPRLAGGHRPRPHSEVDRGVLDRGRESAGLPPRRAPDLEDPQLQAGAGLQEHPVDLHLRRPGGHG